MKRSVVVCIFSLMASSALYTISLFVEVSIGELIDKITILEIKASRIRDEMKLKNVANELEALTTALSVVTPTQILNDLKNKLKLVNELLWDVEDALRIKEHTKTFDDEFTQLARAVYINNDERARIKKQINEVTGSRLIEEKSYQTYGTP